MFIFAKSVHGSPTFGHNQDKLYYNYNIWTIRITFMHN